MKAVIINALAIIVGTFAGNLIGNRFSKKLEEEILDILGIAVIYIGISSALKGENTLLIVISLVIGVALGNLINIEEKLNGLGDKVLGLVSKRSKTSQGNFIEGFVTASLIFSVGSMAILGSISAGILKDNSILITKSILDGVTSIVLASSLGFGVGFSSLVVFIYQGLIVIFSSFLKDIFTPGLIADLSGVGGILIMAIGFNMLKIKKLNTANMLPAILVPIVYESLIRKLIEIIFG
ncbi:DUF554 domain-containing protein [Peptoniphilus catoniae]|uniref:DUF554 domain-containing protein n=1 Tax=Peptoniphilus catoniae TaxID=1660341 RepID=UPI0010FD37A5|nr:DUF554 domain-containing protein [Peptoniphilus catoniae]